MEPGYQEPDEAGPGREPVSFEPGSAELPTWCAAPERSDLRLEGQALPGGVASLARKSCHSLGSGAGCDVQVANASVGATHALLLHHRNGLAYIVDLGFEGGTYVNRARLPPHTPAPLRHGAVVQLAAAPALMLQGGELATVKELLRGAGAGRPLSGQTEDDSDAAADDRVTRANTARNRCGRRARVPHEGALEPAAAELEPSAAGSRKRALEADGGGEGPPAATEGEAASAADCAIAPRKRRRALPPGARVFFSDVVDEIDPEADVTAA